ncbi:nucleotide sugar dehydrogenase [Legionella yabuuchiae]|uniref:nucleotide sugar dehydrogenase n=1 Tax=Legionella yabuuchiae TaxID=376727 RepID=UPI001054669C|nr:nucleotide sugar dehydrogenase [Legionella yabuuchiae]
MKKTIVAVIGTGYVGLQLASIFAKANCKVIAFDINEMRIKELSQGIDTACELKNFQNLDIMFTHEINDLKSATHYIAAPPTPINIHFVPDLQALKSVCKLIGSLLTKEDVIVFEPTIYPGATEELLIPILEEQSRLKSGIDFYVGYSPERIVPGDPEYRIETVTKVISGQNKKALNKIKKLYEKAFPVKPYIAPSIKVAEACKLLENIQRDVNIALMNEYAQVMSAMDISIYDVLDAANTKWNFLPFKPGFVGGHCIPLDPYYLIYQAHQYAINPNLIETARQVNEHFVSFILGILLKKMTNQRISFYKAKVALLGISFKPNTTDTRHSLSLDLYKRLKAYSIEVYACDDLADRRNLNLNWIDWKDIRDFNAIVLIQPHQDFLEQPAKQFIRKLTKHGVFIDLPGSFRNQLAHIKDIAYWSL